MELLIFIFLMFLYFQTNIQKDILFGILLLFLLLNHKHKEGFLDDFNFVDLEDICSVSELITDEYVIPCRQFACTTSHAIDFEIDPLNQIPLLNTDQCGYMRYRFDNAWFEEHNECKTGITPDSNPPEIVGILNTQGECEDFGCSLDLESGTCKPGYIGKIEQLTTSCEDQEVSPAENSPCLNYTEINDDEEAENVCQIIKEINEDGTEGDDKCVYIRGNEYEDYLCNQQLIIPDCSTMNEETCDADFCEWIMNDDSSGDDSAGDDSAGDDSAGDEPATGTCVEKDTPSQGLSNTMKNKCERYVFDSIINPDEDESLKCSYHLECGDDREEKHVCQVSRFLEFNDVFNNKCNSEDTKNYCIDPSSIVSPCSSNPTDQDGPDDE